MDNSYFLFSKDQITIERLHICTWEFKTSCLIEFGFEVSNDGIPDYLKLEFLIPWLTNNTRYTDLYNQLKDSTNSRFIFNDSVIGTNNIDHDGDMFGVVHKFTDREKLGVLPINSVQMMEGKMTLELDLKMYKKYCKSKTNKPNAYFRLSIEPTAPFISVRKKGISKATIIYDIKINEKRNIPDFHLKTIKKNKLCDIKKCFCFNIIPNSYDISFFDSSSLMNVRTLEYPSFVKYMPDKRLQKDELMVIFSKKRDADSFSFFNIYTKELIGTGQIAAAILVNMICSFLLIIPPHKTEDNVKIDYGLFIAILLALTTVIYFVGSTLKLLFKKNRS